MSTSTPAYKRTSTARRTSNYTLTATVYGDDADLATSVLQGALTDAGAVRQATTGERTGGHATAGVAWRSTDDAAAQAVTRDLLAALTAAGLSVLDATLHTGFGVHTRYLEVA